MNKPTCNNSECIKFDCEFYENNGQPYGYCWASGCCTNEIDFDKVKSCEDVISRQSVLEQIYLWSKDEFLRVTNPFNYLRKRINSLPSTTSQSKTGHWVKYCRPRCGEQHYQCTSCGYYVNFGQWGEVYTKQFKYCPNCGIKMEGEQK